MGIFNKEITGKKTEKILGIIFIPLGVVAVLYLLSLMHGQPNTVDTEQQEAVQYLDMVSGGTINHK